MSLHNWINANQTILSIIFVLFIEYCIFLIERLSSKKNCCLIYLFFGLFYSFCVAYKTLWGRAFRNAAINLSLFWSYRAVMAGQLGMLEEIFLNILLFMPCGGLFYAAFRDTRLRWIPLVIGLCLTVFIESSQYIFGKGLCELDDIFNNIIGTVLGILFTKFILIYRERELQ